MNETELPRIRVGQRVESLSLREVGSVMWITNEGSHARVRFSDGEQFWLIASELRPSRESDQ